MIVTQSCHSNVQSDREVELTTSRKMPTMIIRDRKKEAKHESVKIKRIVKDLHSVIVDSKRIVFFEF